MIALLPMKANSERIPGKNVKPLNGKPMFFYIADVMNELELFETLAINTDSAEISRLAKIRYGNWVSIINRPLELLGDNVAMNLIINHDISILGLNNDYFQTHSTSPLLSGATIESAVASYQVGKIHDDFDSMFSVNALKTRMYDKNLSPINHDPGKLIRTQDLEVIYEENSSFYIFSGDVFMHRKHRIGINPRPYIMNRNSIETIDIDEPADWQLAELILKTGYAP
jgi:CMP-N-acetylneuraminic acid synthetase